MKFLCPPGHIAVRLHQQRPLQGDGHPLAHSIETCAVATSTSSRLNERPPIQCGEREHVTADRRAWHRASPSARIRSRLLGDQREQEWVQ
jgi:hypothetical protein